jgi:hypothetical protein
MWYQEFTFLRTISTTDQQRLRRDCAGETQIRWPSKPKCFRRLSPEEIISAKPQEVGLACSCWDFNNDTDALGLWVGLEHCDTDDTVSC